MLEAVARFKPTRSFAETPAKRAYKKHGAKKGRRGRKPKNAEVKAQ